MAEVERRGEWGRKEGKTGEKRGGGLWSWATESCASGRCRGQTAHMALSCFKAATYREGSVEEALSHCHTEFQGRHWYLPCAHRPGLWWRFVLQEGELFPRCFRLETPTDGVRCKMCRILKIRQETSKAPQAGQAVIMLDKLCPLRPRSLSFTVWLLRWRARLPQLGPGSAQAGGGGGEPCGDTGLLLITKSISSRLPCRLSTVTLMWTHTLLSYLQVGKQK